MFSGENLVAIEDMEESGHATHLLLDVFLQVVVLDKESGQKPLKGESEDCG